MPYAINLALDPQTTLRIERLHAELLELGVDDGDLITQYDPCVTLLVVDDTVHFDDIAEALRRRLPRLSALAATLGEPCSNPGYPPALGLAVAPTEALLQSHAALYSALPPAAIHLHYRPAHWRPHVKIASLRGGSGRPAAGSGLGWTPLQATLDRIEVMHYFPVQAVWQARLRPSS